MLWFSQGLRLFSQSTLGGPGSLVGQVSGRREALLQVFGLSSNCLLPLKLKMAANNGNSR